jgi:hypothetical protein
LQVAEFVSEVDLLHSELEKLESSARVSLFVYAFPSCCRRRTLVVHDGLQHRFFKHYDPQSLQELDTYSIQLETAFRQAAAKAK